MNTSALEQALGIPLQQSPVYTAKYLLEYLYRGKEQVIRDATFDLRDLPFYESALDLIFSSPLTPDMVGQTLHHFDKNSAYLAACSSTNTGIGDPVHLAGDGIVPGLPGIYRVTPVYIPDEMFFDGRYMPLIVECGQEWVTNDVLVFAISKGYHFDIHEAWVFNDYDRILGNRDAKRNWSKRIWDARQAMKAVDKEAYEKMKAIALVGMGSFATSKDKYAGLHLIHPNWFFDHVGKARVNMLCNIERYSCSGAILALAYSDGLWYVSRDANYRTAIPDILARMDMLGGYKHVYSFTITPEIVEKSQGLRESQLVSFYHKTGKHHEQ